MKRLFPRILATGALALVATTACTSATRSVSGDMPPADGGIPPYTAADVRFMSGMIPHHAQAILMADWAPTHGANLAVRTLSERMLVSQRDEIEFMQNWLQARGETVPDANPSHAMHGQGHPVLMPGMLTAEELAQLDRARGSEFDWLFLTFMIQHHQGAITMVEKLFSAPGAAQDEAVFRFAADVHADQIAEIERMSRMLVELSSEA